MKTKPTLNILASISNGKIIGKNHINDTIENILFDSRRLNTIQNTVFFAIETKNHSGMNYISDLYDKGIRLFVVQQNPNNIYSDASYLVVDDVVQVLQLLAEYWRKNFNIPVVAITGSNGKTITKDWIVKLIDGDMRVCCNTKSFNSQIGVPISVYQLDKQDNIAIFEAGISMPYEMEKLQKIIRPTIGIFTNIGDAHQTNFQSIEEKIDEKLKLFTHCKTLIFHNNNPILTNKILSFANKHSIKLIAWGYKSLSQLTEKNNIFYNQKDIEQEIRLPFLDEASKENAINAYLLCIHIGIDKQHLLQRIPLLEQLECRFEIKEGINNSIIVNDSYSNDLKSLEVALDYLNTQNKQKKIVILSDLTQTNSNKKQLFDDINNLLINKKITSLIAIGKDFYNNQQLITLKDTEFYLTVRDFLNNLKRNYFTDKAILIKGASSMNFNLISQSLSLKAHQSILEINLSALEDNVRYFKSKLKKDVLVMAMVKANSYGCGGYEVAYALQKNNLADYFTVAFADEGIELRRNGITKPIMVMTPENNIDLFKQYNLEPVIHSFEVLHKFISENINIHIKLDTGMHRLGFEQADINNLISILKQHKNIHIKSVFSHLYGADDSNLDSFTKHQIEIYEQLSQTILQNFDYKIIRHLCNSAATIRFPNIHYDMIRLGIGMYGIGINQEEQKHLHFVHRLRTTITQERQIQKDEDVSYSRKFVSPTKMRIGVIPIGYADGLNRHLGNENLTVYVNGSYCKIIGNICMDMCMIDITNIDAKEGDTVIIFGEENPVFKLSSILNTIPYEIFTSVSNRIKRIYYQE